MAVGRVLVIAHQYLPWHPRVRAELDALAAANVAADVVCLREVGQTFRGSYRGMNLYRLPVGRHRGSGLPVYLLEYLAFFLMAAAFGSWLWLRRRHAVVVTHSLPDPLVFAALVPRLFGARVVLNLHELTPELFQTRYGLAGHHPVIRLARILERGSCRFAGTVITVHDVAARLLASRGVPREKLVVITNAVEMTGQPIFRRFRQDRPFDLLYHGTIGNEYDLTTVVDALALLRDRGLSQYEVRLRVVGDGPGLARVRARADEMDVADRVLFEAPIAYEEVPALLESCDAGVVLMRETPYAHLGLPTKFLECVAAGLPLITTPGSAIRAYVPEDAVCYVPFGDAAAVADAMESLRAHPDRGSELARRAWSAVHPIRGEVMARRYVETLSGSSKRHAA